MVWPFSRGTPQQPDFSQFGIPPPAGAAGGAGASGTPPDELNLTKAEKKAMEAYRFDSSALERAAQAAKELEKSSK